MRIAVVAVGRMKAGVEKALLDVYARRITWAFTVREVEEKRANIPAERIRREGELLLAQCAAAGRRVVLDERGRSLSSEQFAVMLNEWRDSGVNETAFLIGGADGHSDAVSDGAHFLLSFGAMTWPHMLVRVMLTEQIYRAQCILNGHPYHRG